MPERSRRYKFTRDRWEVEQPEMAAMLGRMDKQWIRSLTVFLYLVGCRISEALALRRRDFWMDEGQLVVKVPILKKRQKEQTAYGPSAHLMHIGLGSPFMKDVLLPYLDGIKDPDARVWTYGRTWSWHNIKKANPNISPHIFRHSRLTQLALLGADDLTLQDWAGWADTRPASSYVHAAGRLARKFADRIT